MDTFANHTNARIVSLGAAQSFSNAAPGTTLVFASAITSNGYPLTIDGDDNVCLNGILGGNNAAAFPFEPSPAGPIFSPMLRFPMRLLKSISTAALLLAAALPASSDIMKTNNPSSASTETLTLGGGCFWCLEALFETLPGVKSVASGYAGGKNENPTYQQICGGDTGHAEVVQVQFDPAQISLGKLLESFWVAHDPTTLNRQGNDVGTQYRSVIFYHSDTQRAAAEQSKATAQKELSRPIVTEIVPLKTFYRAEEYHQDYFRKNPANAYCQAVIPPKLKKFKAKQAGQ